MEQYSKEFWRTAMTFHNMHLSSAIGFAIQRHEALITKWCDGVALEKLDKTCGEWAPAPKEHHMFDARTKYREAPPKPIEWDIVVYWRETLKAGTHGQFTFPAGIDVARLAVNPSHPKMATLASLKAKFPGFKLLSITRVVVDSTGHNLLEYTTKLENLGRVPF